uniref:Uncharacterized protein n=1 Tax=Klebsiella pneumoniae TaxID=573 RepID=A0A6M3HDH5_KLEPN|nr:hypothetical protein [Klebsiella pneumoniae]
MLKVNTSTIIVNLILCLGEARCGSSAGLDGAAKVLAPCTD